MASPTYFIESTYTDASNRQSKEYIMTRDGFTFLVMGFTGKEAFISGRELHEFLEIGTQYSKWFDRMCEYGFEENQDFVGLSEKTEKPLGGRPSVDHAMKIDMAKEISMLQRTDK